MLFLGQAAGLGQTARIERSLFHYGGSASTRDGPAPLSVPVFFSPNLAHRDLTGGTDLGARPPAAIFLHFLSLSVGVSF